MPEAPELTQVLAVHPTGPDEFTSQYLAPSRLPLFGGQVAAQALSAAYPTVDADYVISSANLRFLSGGDSLSPVTYTVQRQRDSRSFAHRQVLATQGHRLIAHAGFTFHVPESGEDVQVPSMPDAPALKDCHEIASLAPGFESRVPPTPPEYVYSPNVWARPAHPLGDDPRLNATALLYLSDAHSGIPMLHAFGPRDFHASLDHAIWFHRPALLNDWVFMDKIGESLADGRGWYRGQIFSSSGVLLASMAQEMVVRPAATKEVVQ